MGGTNTQSTLGAATSLLCTPAIDVHDASHKTGRLPDIHRVARDFRLIESITVNAQALFRNVRIQSFE